jgi:hypothetical protein
MWIERPRREDSRYVSWWPLDPSNIENLVLCNPAWPNTFSYDVHLEGRNPNRDFMTNVGSRAILDEAAMVRAWDRWTSVDCYSPADRNCCTTIAHLLRDAGGAVRHQSWEPLTWWGPNDIVEYMGYLNRSVPVLEPLAMRFPPADVPRAPRSPHFSRYG